MPSIFKWSKNPSANGNSDPDINWQEGQFPGTVNNSARALEAGIANWRDDIGGQLTLGGVVNVYTLATNSVLLAPQLVDGAALGFVCNITNTGAATLNVDGLGAKALRKLGDVDIEAGDLVANGHYLVQYDASANGAAGAWLLLNPSTFTGFSGNLVATGAFSLTGDITPPQIVADTPDYAPSGFAAASTLRLSTDALRTVSGIAGGADGRFLVVHNVGAFPLALSSLDAASAAANQFQFSNTPIVLPAGGAIALRYDGVSSKWRGVVDMAARVVPRDLVISGSSTPAALSVATHDYSPAGLADGAATTFRLSSTVQVDLTGLVAGVEGRTIALQNVGTFPIILKNDNVGSVVANRLILGGDRILGPGAAITLRYDTTSSRWRLTSTSTDVFSGQLLHVKDERASGTDSGGSTSGVFVQRVLNAVKTNQISGASLGSNQVTLPAGTYLVIGSCPAYSVDFHKARLRNITDNATLIVGSSEKSSTGALQTRSMLTGIFTITATKVIEAQHYVSNTVVGNGLGRATSSGEVESYADLMFWKLA